MGESEKTVKRTRSPDGGNGQMTPQQLQTFSEVVNRAVLAAKLGYQYGTDRDLYQALGYPVDLTYADFYVKYSRLDIARAIIDRPVKVTWRGPLEIVESDDDKETSLEKEWKALDDRLGIKSRLMRLDKLTGIGNYGVLLLGLSDVRKREDYATPVVGAGKKLLYVKPLGQNHAKITKWESHTANERYGMPLEYEITITDATSNTSSVLAVHWSRVIHIVDEMLESEVDGTPRLQAVYNRLMDLEKLVGGDAEMFWRGARPGFQGKLDQDFTMTADTKADLINQIDEYEHNLRRILVSEGLDLHSLASQIADPKNHVDIQMQMISAVTGIPKRILTGSERGELSSTQDQEEWNSFVQSRREEYAEPRVVRPFVDRLIKYGVLPKPVVEGEYYVKWQDLFAPSEKDKVEIGKGRAEALAKYAASPMAEGIVPPDAFLEKFLGLTEEEVELIQEQLESHMKEEEKNRPTPEEEAALLKEQQEQGMITQGGKGSGNFGHEGRPGEVGGSGGGGGELQGDWTEIKKIQIESDYLDVVSENVEFERGEPTLKIDKEDPANTSNAYINIDINYPIVGKFADGKVLEVGGASAHIHGAYRERNKVFEITLIRVDDQLKRKGIGSFLVKKLTSEVKSGYSIKTSEVFSSEGRAFFTKLISEGVIKK